MKRKNIKNISSVLLISAILSLALMGCTGNENSGSLSSKSENPNSSEIMQNSSAGSESSAISVENTNLFEFTVEDGTATLTKYKGDLTEVFVPSIYEGAPVTKIGQAAFKGCDKITSVHLPDGVKEIDVGAFRDCTSLKNIDIPDSVVKIENAAFLNTPWLEGIYESTPGNEIYIGSTFYKYRGEMPENTKLVVRDGTTFISGYLTSSASNYKKNLIEVVIPEGVTEIEDAAFYECMSLKKITLPSTLKTIGAAAFQSCHALTDVNIPEGVNTIKSRAFRGCSALNSINIPSTVETIGDSAFSNCEALKSITIPNGVKDIQNEAFSSCSSLESAVISSEKLENYVFRNCPNLKDITLTKSVKYIFTDALSKIYSDFTLHVSAGSQGEEYAKEANINYVTE